MSDFTAVGNTDLLARILSTLFWSLLTIGVYLLFKRVHKRWPHLWTAPLVAAPIVLTLIMLLSHKDYAIYMHATHWLIVLMGPAIVAFALPIYRQRAMILRYWRTLAIGVVCGSAISIASAWGLAALLGVDGSLRLSLLPRSISTPFAMTISGEIGGVPALTAIFVIITGIWGAAFGEMFLNRLPLQSSLAHGSSFGLGAHVVGSTKANSIDQEIGAVAALVMVLTGVFNVVITPLLTGFLN